MRKFTLSALLSLAALSIVACGGGGSPRVPAKPTSINLRIESWVIAQDFASDHIDGDFDLTPATHERLADGGYFMTGKCTTADGKVHHIVAELEQAGGSNWRCRELYIDAQRVR